MTYTLGPNLEALEFTGSCNINGTGNVFGNTLIGNSGDNTLSGLDGADVIDGRGGNDTLNGGNLNDVFKFQAAFGDDRVLGFDSSPQGGQDRIDVSAFGITTVDFNERVTISSPNPNRADTLVTIEDSLGAVEGTIRLIGVATRTIDGSDFLGVLAA